MRSLPVDRAAIMGILNVTPDSFSDGGQFLDPSAAIDQALKMVAQGADLIDVGGESTRPRSTPVTAAEELRRVLPVVAALADQGVWVSIDTQKPEVAAEALAAGAHLVNDVGGMRNPFMRATCAKAECHVCVMHMQGTPQAMQTNPTYHDVVCEIREYLEGQAALCITEGIPADHIWIDPGFGFGKTSSHNRELLAGLDQICSLPFPVLVGLSRKSFLAQFAPNSDPESRLSATLGAQTVALLAGASVLRVHDVVEAKQIVGLAAALSTF